MKNMEDVIKEDKRFFEKEKEEYKEIIRDLFRCDEGTEEYKEAYKKWKEIKSEVLKKL